MSVNQIPEHNRLNEQRRGLIEFIKNCGNPSLMCQIGVATGNDTEIWIELLPKLKIYSIDHWNCEKPHLQSFSGEEGYRTFLRRFEMFPNVVPIKLCSKEASQIFVDKYFDVVYIDARHEYLPVKEDIILWIDKVKTGGIIGGHDYCEKWPGVKRAVNEFFNEKEIMLFEDSSWMVRL